MAIVGDAELKIKASLDDADATSKLEALASKAEEIEKKFKNIKLDTSGLSDVTTSLKALKTPIKVDLDTSEATNKINALKEALQGIGKLKNEAKAGKNTLADEKKITNEVKKQAEAKVTAAKKAEKINPSPAPVTKAQAVKAQQPVTQPLISRKELSKFTDSLDGVVSDWNNAASKSSAEAVVNKIYGNFKGRHVDDLTDGLQGRYSNWIANKQDRFNEVNNVLQNKDNADSLFNQLANFNMKVKGSNAIRPVATHVQDLFEGMKVLQDLMVSDDFRAMANPTEFRTVKNLHNNMYASARSLLRDPQNYQQGTKGILAKDLIKIDDKSAKDAGDVLIKALAQEYKGSGRTDYKIRDFNAAKGTATITSHDNDRFYRDKISLRNVYDNEGKLKQAMHYSTIADKAYENADLKKSNKLATRFATTFGTQMQDVTNLAKDINGQTSFLNNLGDIRIKVSGVDQLTNVKDRAKELVASLQQIQTDMSGKDGKLIDNEMYAKKAKQFKETYKELQGIINNPLYQQNSKKGTLANELFNLNRNDAEARQQILDQVAKYYKSQGVVRQDYQLKNFNRQNGTATVSSRTDDMVYTDRITLGNTFDEAGNAANNMRVLTVASRDYLTTSEKVANAFKTQGMQLKGYLMNMVGAAAAFQMVRKGFQEAISLNDRLSNISMTMDVSRQQLNQIQDSSIKMGQSLGTSAEDVMNAVTIYANANETADSILQKAKPTIMLANASGVDTATAADQIQAVTQQFSALEGKEREIVSAYEKISAGKQAMPVSTVTCY